MPDYGHDIQFGAFLTPQNRDPEQVVALARHCESIGLELVTFQDHPYQNQFLDTWTLLSWVAAQTSTIHIAPNVLNLPLRPPAVLARAAASLDLLSSGRLELGLGAGAFWEAMVAMGIERRTPGEAVTALSEAIDIIRAIWDTSTRSGVRHHGEIYTVDGMTRGPDPAHDIGIWLGAYKPRMLRLTGAKADAWIPSQGYLAPSGLAAANRVIDQAADTAGRDRAAIRRMYNINGQFLGSQRGFLQGPPALWAEQLTGLALNDGIATFILGSDDPDDLSAFALEVAPDVRERVAKARGEEPPPPVRTPEQIWTTTGVPRSVKIDYGSIPDSLRGGAVAPDQPGYSRVRSTYMAEGSPGLVLMTENAQQVADAITFARRQPVPLSVRSGGHGTNGLSTNDGGIIIDLARINRVEVLDEATGLFRVGAGATWGQVAEGLAPHGLAMTSGDFSDVGVGGIVTAGGIGLLARKYGLTIDHVVAASVVLADGRVVRASEEENPDLFWGIRGAGANLGIVTQVEMTGLPVSNVIYGMFVLDASDMAGLLRQWGAHLESAPRELSANLYLSPARRGQPAVAQIVTVWSDDDIPAATAALEPILTWAPVLQQGAQLVPYAAIMAPQNAPHSGQQSLKARTGLLRHLDEETARAIATLMRAGRVPWANIRMLGGAVNDIPAGATAFPHRAQNFCFTAYDLYPDRRNLDPAWEAFRPLTEGSYLNLETDMSESTIREIYPSPAYERLQQLKTEYDPENVFNRNFNIPPLP